MKPIQIFLFLATLLIFLGSISLVFPEDGIPVTEEYSIYYPKLDKLFTPEVIEKKDYSTILESTFDIDSVLLETNRKVDSIRAVKKATRLLDSLRKWQLKLHYPNNDKSILHPLFESFDKAANNSPIRVLHYGDSQIEGDRISGYLRHKLQYKFGGFGPGFIAAVPLVSSSSIRHEASDNWQRHTFFGKRDTLVNHTKYGLLATFGRFAPIYNDSIYSDSTILKGTLTFKRSNITYPRTKVYSRMKLFYGNNHTPVSFSLQDGDSLIKQDQLPPTDNLSILTHNFSKTPKSITLNFEGVDSPDIYGISLEGATGIQVDNIAMRGSAGTLFRRLDSKLLASSYANLNVKLLILQYGGNVMPYMNEQKKVDHYGRWFESQLTLLKSMIPDVSIIVIGPSDMGTIERGEYVTYPLLEKVRDALKTATFNQNGVYWDLYEAMGGEKSMEAWVSATPRLAARDYVHFNHNGSSKVAQMFYNALIEEYNIYHQSKTLQARLE